MYCPKCAATNPDSASFCRSCGLDLSVVARAMEKHLPRKLLRKIDAHLSNRKEIKRRDSILDAIFGIILVGVSISSFRYDSWQSGVLFLAVGAISFIIAVWNYLIFIRSRSETKLVEPEDSWQSGDIVSIIGDREGNQKVLPEARETAKITAQINSQKVGEKTTELFPIQNPKSNNG